MQYTIQIEVTAFEGTSSLTTPLILRVEAKDEWQAIYKLQRVLQASLDSVHFGDEGTYLVQNGVAVAKMDGDTVIAKTDEAVAKGDGSSAKSSGTAFELKSKEDSLCASCVHCIYRKWEHTGKDRACPLPPNEEAVIERDAKHQQTIASLRLQLDATVSTIATLTGWSVGAIRSMLLGEKES